MKGARLLGVVEHGEDGASLSYLNQEVEVDAALLAKSGSVPPTVVFRFAAPCVESRCTHFDGQVCRLAARVVEQLEPTVDKLPPCTIRKTCRWYGQEGMPACTRCPQVVTRVTDESTPLYAVAQGQVVHSPDA